MNKVYLVNHPIEEPHYTPNAEVQTIGWNCDGRHKRKLFKHDGIYIEDIDAGIKYAPLYFWGEYEPYTCAHIQNNNLPAIHDDLKSARNVFPTQFAGMLNTDPYVFGCRFRYICCFKSKRLLKHNDIVLFGHYDTHPITKVQIFRFDTVFVTNRDGIAIPKADWEDQYYMASARFCTGINDYYAEGLMHSEREPLFCFVPCRNGDLCTEGVDYRMRFPYSDLPYLETSILGINNVNPRTRHCVDYKSAIWRQIIEAVKNANMVFGIYLAEI